MPYASVVGCLMHVMVSNKTDISHAVNLDKKCVGNLERTNGMR